MVLCPPREEHDDGVGDGGREDSTVEVEKSEEEEWAREWVREGT